VEARVGKIGMAKTKGRKEKEKEGRKQEEKEKIKRKQTRRRIMEVKRVIEEWEIWDKEKEVVKSKKKSKKLVSPRSYKWIHVFGKKVSKIILMRKMQ